MKEKQDERYEEEYAEVVNALEFERTISGDEATFLRNLYVQVS